MIYAGNLAARQCSRASDHPPHLKLLKPADGFQKKPTRFVPRPDKKLFAQVRDILHETIISTPDDEVRIALRVMDRQEDIKSGKKTLNNVIGEELHKIFKERC